MIHSQITLNKNDLMKKLMILFLALFVGLPLLTAQSTSQPLPSTNQVRWHEAEMGVVFHYDLHVFDTVQYAQGANRITPLRNHNIFNPEELDTDQWVKAAKDAGAKFAILTATHETGFALYQSEVNPYCLKSLNWRDGKGDIVDEFVKSCRKYDILPGIYIGIRWNSLFGVHNFKVEGSGEFAKRRQTWYKTFCEDMVREICTKYGDLFMIWFDGGADDPAGLGPDVLPIISELQPNCLFYHNIQKADLRWGGSESGTVGYPCWSTFPNPYSHSSQTESEKEHTKLLKHGDKDGKYWVSAMADTPLRGANGRHEWFWEPGDEYAIYDVNTLMDMYNKSVGRNATLIVGLTPDNRGLLPQADVKRLQEWGAAINKQFSNSLGSVQGHTRKLEIKLGKEQLINQVVIQEEIAKGENIRSYKVQARVKGKWVDICKGESVGHKRIQTFDTIETSRLRLIIEESIQTPHIKDFSVYYREN